MKAFYKILAIVICMVTSFTKLTACNFGGSINLGGGNNQNNQDDNGGLGGDNTDEDDDNSGDNSGDNGGNTQDPNDQPNDNNDNTDNGGDNGSNEQPDVGDDNDDNNNDNNDDNDNAGDSGDDNTGDNTGDSSDDNTGSGDDVVEGSDALIQGGVTYSLLEDGYYAVTEFDASVTEVTILGQVNGTPVCEIASGAFRAKKKITKVTLPESLVEIGDSAFKDCVKLSEINLENVEIIGANAFENAFADKRATINLSSLEEIGLKAFLNCPKLGVVDFGNAPVVEIPKQCFASCSLLYTVNLSQYTTYLEESCFDSCNLLTNINLDKVEYINLNAFRGCASITEIQLDSIIEIGDYAFLNCNMLARVVIGENAGRIYLGAFRTLYALTYFEIKTATTKDWRYYFVNAYEDRNDKLTADGWSGEDKLADPAACAEWITIRKNNYVFICTSEWSDAMGIVPGKMYPKGQTWSKGGLL